MSAGANSRAQYRTYHLCDRWLQNTEARRSFTHDTQLGDLSNTSPLLLYQDGLRRQVRHPQILKYARSM